jgi:hypothetical protein
MHILIGIGDQLQEQYFSYIVAVSFIAVEQTGVSGESHRPASSH